MGAYNSKVHGRAAKGSHAEMPVDTDDLGRAVAQGLDVARQVAEKGAHLARLQFNSSQQLIALVKSKQEKPSSTRWRPKGNQTRLQSKDVAIAGVNDVIRV
jgi:hypothetical protein